MSKGDEYLRVEFYYQAVEDRDASQEKGRLINRDEEWVRITMPGSGSPAVNERKATDRDKSRFKAQYEAWKEDREAPVDGLRLEDWGVLTPAQVSNLKEMGIRSVEALAGVEGNLLKMIPAGPRLKERAKSYLKAAENVGKVAAENEILRQKNDELEIALRETRGDVVTLQEENEKLRAERDRFRDLKNALDEPKKRGRPRKEAA